jgi:unsaturated rhamnogalacturonyl hydrolase
MPKAKATTGGSTRAMMALVARRTLSYDMTVWFWGDAIACDGLMDAAELVRVPGAQTHVERLFARWTDKRLDWVDYLTPGWSLLRIHAASGDARYREGADRLASLLLDKAPKGPGGHALWRPDLPAYRHSIWIDSLYHVPTFYAALGAAADDLRFSSAAVEMFRRYMRTLKSRKGPLLEHSYDVAAERPKGYGWGRGQGWALLGLADCLEILPARIAGRDLLERRFKDLCAAVLTLQDRSGFWRTLMHDHEAYLESSTAAFMGAVFVKGMRLGLLDKSYAEPAARAWDAMTSRVDRRGGLTGVSAVTWSWVANLEEATMYKTLPTEVNLWGQGAALRFCAERLRAGLD